MNKDDYKSYKTDTLDRNLPAGAVGRLGVIDLLSNAGNDNTFTRHLRSLMSKYDLDTLAVSESIGVNQRTVQRYQNTDYTMDLPSMQLKSFLGLAALFGDDFLGGAINWPKLESFLTEKSKRQ